MSNVPKCPIQERWGICRILLIVHVKPDSYYTCALNADVPLAVLGCGMGHRPTLSRFAKKDAATDPRALQIAPAFLKFTLAPKVVAI